MSSCRPQKLIEDELNHTHEVVERARRACRDLEADPAKNVTNVPIRQTFLEAFATIQRREDDRRKSSKQESKSKQQKKAANEANPQFRGTKIGVDPEVSAYWMVMEDYCRPVQSSDLQLLLPQHESLTEDTAFFMPPLGFNPTQDEAPETDDGHDGSAPSDPAPDSNIIPTGHVTLKADPVDSTMHEATGGSGQEVALQHHNGPSLLHGASSASMVNLLQVMGSLFAEAGGENSWQDLADAAAKEEGKVLDTELVDQILSCVAKIETEGEGERKASKSEGLMGYMRILNGSDQKDIAQESITSADSAQTAMLQMLQSCIDRSSEQIMKSLPPIDAASALAGADHTAKPESDAAVVTEQHTDAIAPDEAIHPYLKEFLQRAVMREHGLQEGRKSPSLAAAPGTPMTDHPDAERPRIAAPMGPSTPGTNGIEPTSVCARPSEEEGIEREARQEGGNEAADCAQPRQPDIREVSVDCSSMAYSMDCSTDVKEAPTSTPGLAENNSAPQTTQQQRRSSRKRNRQERDADGNGGAQLPAKRGATPGAAIRESSLSRHTSTKGAEARSTPGEDAPISAEPSTRQKPARGGRSKGEAKVELAGASCESDGALELIKDESKVSAQPVAADKESSAPNGAAAGVVHASQEHDSTVAACCLEEQWANVNNGLDVLAIAPDDEVVAEIISLQTELLQVAAANRKRCAAVLNAVLDDLPAQAEQQADQAKSEQEMESFLIYIRALKRQAKLEKREAERKEAAEALAAAEAAGGQQGGTTATPAVGRARRTAAKHANVHASDDDDEDEESEDEVGGVPLPLAGAYLVDPYALEVPDAINALCAVCGDGESKPNDQIVFCDRCNVAVHQHCYGVGEIPQGDWLCWPCRLYEDTQKAEGKSQDDIRPPRFKESGIPDYPGGSKEVACELCPMKRGIFKQTVPNADGPQKWVHVVCALWQTPEVSVAPVNNVEAISGLGNIKPENSCMTCAYCRKRIGATVKCAHNKCHTTFHPLCARKVGCFSACHHSTGRGRPTYKTWCAQHSEAARRRERDAPARSAPVNGEKRATGGPKQPQSVSDVTVSKEDLAALEAQLNSKNEALQFLKGVRYDLEAARILAAQVEKREKGKMHVVDLLKQEYEMVLANPREFVQYEMFLGCRRHHADLVNMMQSTFENKRIKARKSYIHQHEQQRKQLYLQQQQQQQQAHPQRMHQVESMPGMRGSGPGMPGSPGQMMYGHNGPQSVAPMHSMRMGGQVQGQAERMNQPQQYPVQHSSMMGARGGFGGNMIPSGADGDNLLRGLGGYEQPGNSPLVSPSSMLDPVSQQGGRPLMGHEARFSQPQRMQGVSRMPMDHSGVAPGGGGMGNAWQHAAHPHPGYNPHDLQSDHGMRSMHNTGGANQDMMSMNANSFALRGGDVPRQQHPGDHNLGRMPLAGSERGMGAMRETSLLSEGAQYHGMAHMGNGQQYRVQQMRTSDSGFGAQPRQDGMGYMQQHSQDLGIQQSQGGFGAAQNTVTATRTGRSQRAAAQASRGRSYAERNDPFGYMDGYMDD